VERLESGEGAECQGRDQIGEAERAEPQGGTAAGALGEPARDPGAAIPSAMQVRAAIAWARRW
jgi:hypothetical protein